ncbi:MAG: hypothetical protein KDD48_08430, partial [Bdellovibrionales bacterium]|nr:hypothetical protein [Bdellovibrionales bacterium]
SLRSKSPYVNLPKFKQYQLKLKILYPNPKAFAREVQLLPAKLQKEILRTYVRRNLFAENINIMTFGITMT